MANALGKQVVGSTGETGSGAVEPRVQSVATAI
jgi:hypothetical protein